MKSNQFFFSDPNLRLPQNKGVLGLWLRVSVEIVSESDYVERSQTACQTENHQSRLVYS